MVGERGVVDPADFFQPIESPGHDTDSDRRLCARLRIEGAEQLVEPPDGREPEPFIEAVDIVQPIPGVGAQVAGQVSNGRGEGPDTSVDLPAEQRAAHPPVPVVRMHGAEQEGDLLPFGAWPAPDRSVPDHPVGRQRQAHVIGRLDVGVFEQLGDLLDGCNHGNAVVLLGSAHEGMDDRDVRGNRGSELYERHDGQRIGAAAVEGGISPAAGCRTALLPPAAFKVRARQAERTGQAVAGRGSGR